ncbi:hypothetical protein JHK87_030798 [Glycine soja]|nr:hypothetical protein JHK87_030798 [Glycine soja]
MTQPSRCSNSHIPLLNQCKTVIEPLQQPSITTHSNRKSSSFQYLLPQSFSPEQKNAFDTLSSSAAINPLNVIAMSSQSSIDSSVVPPKLMGTTITYQFVTAFHNDRVLPPTALPYLDASAPNMTILKNHGHPLQWKLTLNDPDFGQ